MIIILVIAVALGGLFNTLEDGWGSRLLQADQIKSQKH